jgi:GTP cyclohydrolase II
VIEILGTLGISEMTLLTNNPEKVKALRDNGFSVTQENLAAQIHQYNEKYIETKRVKLGHERGNA